MNLETIGLAAACAIPLGMTVLGTQEAPLTQEQTTQVDGLRSDVEELKARIAAVRSARAEALAAEAEAAGTQLTAAPVAESAAAEQRAASLNALEAASEAERQLVELELLETVRAEREEPQALAGVRAKLAAVRGGAAQGQATAETPEEVTLLVDRLADLVAARSARVEILAAEAQSAEAQVAAAQVAESAAAEQRAASLNALEAAAEAERQLVELELLEAVRAEREEPQALAGVRAKLAAVRGGAAQGQATAATSEASDETALLIDRLESALRQLEAARLPLEEARFRAARDAERASEIEALLQDAREAAHQARGRVRVEGHFHDEDTERAPHGQARADAHAVWRYAQGDGRGRASESGPPWASDPDLWARILGEGRVDLDDEFEVHVFGDGDLEFEEHEAELENKFEFEFEELEALEALGIDLSELRAHEFTTEGPGRHASGDASGRFLVRVEHDRSDAPTLRAFAGRPGERVEFRGGHAVVFLDDVDVDVDVERRARPGGVQVVELEDGVWEYEARTSVAPPLRVPGPSASDAPHRGEVRFEGEGEAFAGSALNVFRVEREARPTGLPPVPGVEGGGHQRVTVRRGLHAPITVETFLRTDGAEGEAPRAPDVSDPEFAQLLRDMHGELKALREEMAALRRALGDA